MADSAIIDSSLKMDTKESRPSANLFQQAIAGSATAQKEFFQKLSARFLSLAQDILCDHEAAVAVATKALESAHNEYGKLSSDENLIKWTQRVLDNEIENYFQQKAFDGEIENYFQKLVAEIKSGSKKSEGEFFTALNRRFLRLASQRIVGEKENMTTKDVDDIVQNALLTVFKKYRTAQPRGTFIQWAQTILKNKYREYRRKYIKWGRLTGSPITDKDESTYTKTISDVIVKGRKAKEVNEKEIKPSQRKATDQPENNPIEDGRDPMQWVIVDDLKTKLLAIVEKMGERCKRVFKVLFSEGDQKFMYEEFPDKTKDQINIIVSRCRKRLKELAQKEGVL